MTIRNIGAEYVGYCIIFMTFVSMFIIHVKWWKKRYFTYWRYYNLFGRKRIVSRPNMVCKLIQENDCSTDEVKNILFVLRKYLNIEFICVKKSFISTYGPDFSQERYNIIPVVIKGNRVYEIHENKNEGEVAREYIEYKLFERPTDTVPETILYYPHISDFIVQETDSEKFDRVASGEKYDSILKKCFRVIGGKNLSPYRMHFNQKNDVYEKTIYMPIFSTAKELLMKLQLS